MAGTPRCRERANLRPITRNRFAFALVRAAFHKDSNRARRIPFVRQRVDPRVAQAWEAAVQRVLVKKPTPFAYTLCDDQRRGMRSLVIEMKKAERSQHVVNACAHDNRFERFGDRFDRGAAAVLVIAKVKP